MLRLVFCFAVALAAPAATPIFHASFAKPDSGWTAVSGKAVPDTAVVRAGQASLRVERDGTAPDVCVRSAPISLTIGKRYELSGWVRTENLTVRDLNYSQIGTGAALTMASLPFDMHSASVGGTREWQRLILRFTATRAQDTILLTAGNGGTLGGRAWFEGVSLDEVSPTGDWPVREAVQTFGPAYRYPAAGWIYLHIEGQPYERGYQHGYLMAREIPEYLERCALSLGGKNGKDQWSQFRTEADALFLRGFDREILEEMRGIVDGANANGAKWLTRKLDLVDLVVANTTVEMSELSGATETTPTGIEGLRLDLPAYARAVGKDRATDHCSAFAATGPATRDGKMVIGHVTWWGQTLAEQTNVMLDIQPQNGHRLLMQSYPGGIESGTDWYQNDVGIVLTETTIRQTPFNIAGTPVAFRARHAIQYGGNIDEVVHELGTRNNGLYTNEWIIGDGKNNEIAMYELGTRHTRLWRSSNNDWFGDTPGFYWGDNNAKDLTINLEYQPDPQGEPTYVPYEPGIRDLAWQELYRKYKGQIDEQFGFLAFHSAPLISAGTIDAKIATADMANRLMSWAAIGRPNQSVWAAPRVDPGPNRGLFPGGYHLFHAEPSESLKTMIQENEKARLAVKPSDNKPAESPRPASFADRLWKGWVLPATPADIWFVAGSAEYWRLLKSDDPERALEAQRIRYRGLKLAPDDESARFRTARVKGVLFLDSLRRKLGDDAFLKLMADFFAAHTTETVTAQSFLEKAGTAFDFVEPGDGPAYLPGDLWRHLKSAVIVYGTVLEGGANRYAAEQLRDSYREDFQMDVPIYRDFELSGDTLKDLDVVFVGRPATNSALADWAAKLGLEYDGAAFKLAGKTYASERNSVLLVSKNPLSPTHMVLVFAANGPVRPVDYLAFGDSQTPVVVFEDGKPIVEPPHAAGGPR